MTIYTLVEQLRFARSEFVRGLEGVSEEDGGKRLVPMNCISWMVGHLANQENFYWVRFAQGEVLFPGLVELVGTGKPASTPSLAEMWATWKTVTEHADRYLDTITPQIAQVHFAVDGKPRSESVGTMLLRNIYHYWVHTGEASAVRQMLRHKDLAQFVGKLPVWSG